MPFTETDIWQEITLAFQGIPGPFYPEGNPGDIKYNFYPDLENPYGVVAGSRIHVYGDQDNWALVFEISSYHTRRFNAEIELIYIGNCIQYPVDIYPERNYITNMATVELITAAEYERISNKAGTNMELFELISNEAESVHIRGKAIPIAHDPRIYAKVGIALRDFDNPRSLIGFDDLLRYIHETNPEVLYATEQDIRQHIPARLPRLMTTDSFHFESAYDKNIPPASQETFQLLVKVLVNRDTSLWKPSVAPNNHWSHWVSGNF